MMTWIAWRRRPRSPINRRIITVVGDVPSSKAERGHDQI
jgi:hypothetical protein